MKSIAQNHEIKQENSAAIGIDADAIRAEFEMLAKQNTPDADGFVSEDVEDF